MIPRLSQGSFCITEQCVLSHLRLVFILYASSKIFFFLTGKEGNRKTPCQMSAHDKSREFVRIVERNDTASGATVTRVGKVLLAR